jgi:cytochrome c oxidase subunit 1/cytochrome c oxidase subunit I+III
LLNRGWALDDGRETLATTSIDAEPDAILKMPEDSFAPLILAISLSGLFVAMLAQTVGGGVLALCVGFIAMLTWLWPERVTFRPVEESHG